MARPVTGHNHEFLSGSHEWRNAGMAYETTAGRHKKPFLLSYLPAFLRGLGAMIVEVILFGCGYAALECYGDQMSVAHDRGGLFFDSIESR